MGASASKPALDARQVGVARPRSHDGGHVVVEDPQYVEVAHESRREHRLPKAAVHPREEVVGRVAAGRHWEHAASVGAALRRHPRVEHQPVDAEAAQRRDVRRGHVVAARRAQRHHPSQRLGQPFQIWEPRLGRR